MKKSQLASICPCCKYEIGNSRKGTKESAGIQCPECGYFRMFTFLKYEDGHFTKKYIPFEGIIEDSVTMPWMLENVFAAYRIELINGEAFWGGVDSREELNQFILDYFELLKKEAKSCEILPGMKD